jgi:ATP-dependent Clp protease ATP-binding subunit ClpA
MFTRNMFKHSHSQQNESLGELLALCNAGTVEEILAELDAKRQSPPPPEPRTSRAMQLAADDAARQGQSVVTTENMLVGLLRVEGGVFADFFRGLGTDMAKLRAMIGARLLPDSDPLAGQELPADPGAEGAVRQAAADADARRREAVSPLHLVRGLLGQRGEPGAKLLAEAGLDEALVPERLDRSL